LDEVSRYLLVITTFLASSIAVSEILHPAVELLDKFLPANAVNIVRRACAGFCAALSGYVGYHAYFYMMRVAQVGTVTSNLQWPVWIIYMMFLFGFVGMTVRWIMLVFKRSPVSMAHEERGAD
jgi:TRAP-type C4-dicarboxylate transport system permease small subunit